MLTSYLGKVSSVQKARGPIHYRYEVRYSEGVFGEVHPRLEEHAFIVAAETPKGYWLSYSLAFSRDKWVPKSSMKRWAYPTQKEASYNFRRRTQVHVSILQERLKYAQRTLSFANSLWEKQNEH